MTTSDTTIRAVNSCHAVHGLFLLCLIASLSVGCGARPFAEVRPGIEARGHYIDGVPFVRQTSEDCGPASLASVLAFHGRQPDLAAITAAVYLPKLGGTLPMDLERYAKDAGFRTDASSGSLDALRQAVRNNRPVICLLDLGFGLYRRPHYVTVIGFDDGNQLVITHDGEVPDRTMGYEAFGKAWERAGNWMIVVKP
jgi:ABC-type bacteriocin/lantibiotic exporter with double-glycine peptidase domain